MTRSIRTAWLMGFVALLATNLLEADAPKKAEAAPAPLPDGKDIPELKWEKRSDWLDVKTDVTPKAVGDGVADDTAALQAALNGVADPNKGLTVYLPPGTYRITRTLLLNNPRSRSEGFSLIGCGSLTRIVWGGGKSDGPMFFVPKGALFARYVGIVWDGQDKVGVGFQHASHSTPGNPNYETSIRHQHEAFLNMTEDGIRMKDGTSDDLEFQNCLFERCAQGVASYKWNDLAYTFDGCEFRNCGTGIFENQGCTYVRNCRFENSASTDMKLASQSGGSVRRTTSQGSNRFMTLTSPCATYTLQGCHVSGWKDTGGAIVFNTFDLSKPPCPVIIMDCTFSEAPDPGAPVTSATKPPKMISSGNIPRELFRGSQDSVYEIPSSRSAGSPLPAGQSFLKRHVALPGKVFDAVRDFGAPHAPDDASEAIQKAIDAARSCGKGAVAYLPQGTYSVAKTLHVTGGNYSIGGAGRGTCIRWKGAMDQPLFDIQDPDHVTLDNINIGTEDRAPRPDSVDILQRSTPGQASTMTYDNVFVYGQYCGCPSAKGIHFWGLSPTSKVLVRECHGNLTFTDSAQAHILLNVSYYGNVTVQGRSPARTGMLAFLTRFSTEKPYTLYVKNNQSLVMTDYYVEQSENYASLSGEDKDPPGRVTLQGAKIHCDKGKNILNISNYGGQVFVGHNIPSYFDDSKIVQTGSRPCDIILAANLWFFMLPTYQLDTGGKMFRIGCQALNKKYETIKDSRVEDAVDRDTPDKVARSLDDLRRVGQLDLELNHPDVWAALGGGSADQPKPAEGKPAKP